MLGLLQQLLSLWSQGTWTGAAAKVELLEIPEGPLIVIREVFGRGLTPSQATASRPPTPVDEHSVCESMCEGFLFSIYTYLNTANVIQLNHLILCRQLSHICSSVITLQSNSSLSSLYIIIRYWTGELVPVCLPYATTDLEVRWRSSPAGGWSWTSDPSSQSDSLYAERRGGGCAERRWWWRSKSGSVKGSSVLTRCHLTAQLDMTLTLLLSIHTLSFTHPASNPDVPFVIHPSVHPSSTPTPGSPQHTQHTHTVLSGLDWRLPGKGEGSGVIRRRWRIQTARRGEEDSPCRPEVCLPDTVWTDLCVCVCVCVCVFAKASLCVDGDEEKRKEGEDGWIEK